MLFERVGTKIALVITLLLLAIAAPLMMPEPFRLGLDLQGGTRLVTRFDFDKAAEAGKIEKESIKTPTQRAQLLQEFIGIMRERLDPDGLYSPNLRAIGTERVEMELPGITDLAVDITSLPLKETIQATSSSLALDDSDPAALLGFPLEGGEIQIGTESLSYAGRQDGLLTGLTRGQRGTSAGIHEASDMVQTVPDDPIVAMIQNTGEMYFYIVAKPGMREVDQAGISLDRERDKAVQWLKANPGETTDGYNRLPVAEGGPHPSLRWYPQQIREGVAGPPEDRLLPCLIQSNPKWLFTGDNLGLTRPSQDSNGFPAVGFEMKQGRRNDFAAFTKANIDQQMAIVLNGEVVTAPNLNSRLPGGGIISGNRMDPFKQSEVDDLVGILRSGSLRIRPTVEAKEKVGASLGAKSIRSGYISAILGVSLVLMFMIFYYRKLGVFAVLSLLANLILIGGALSLFRTTLTLPGIAGLILTVGMAVDANILIYERIREELDRGRKIGPACKNGFDRALVTIVDANLTTLITAVVLLKIGTGPIRGFATTLVIGIISSVFSALVITRILVHLSLEKGAKNYKMMRLLEKAHYDFMGKAKLVVPISVGIILIGVTWFAMQPAKQKLGIDFLGGLKVTCRLEEPQLESEMRAKIAAIPGDVGKAEVIPILASGTKETGYAEYRITYKAEVDVRDAAASGQTSADEDSLRSISSALAGIIQKGPVELVSAGSADTPAEFVIYFEESHGAADVTESLTGLGYSGLTTTEVGGSARRLKVVGTPPVSLIGNADSMRTRLIDDLQKLSDAGGRRYRLSSPFPENTSVGAQVVGDMRDKAILAMLISLFAVVLYIRARFAEYSYGFAAVVALVHDVLFTLGILAVVNGLFGWGYEISLPMIAAFLTIIGYSLNDTIVVFDRIRENKPRMKKSLREVLNASINQTLSRTLLTSVTTLFVVLILYVFNFRSGSVLESFAFALLIGVMIGTYSSIFVASPVLMWIENRSAKKSATADGGSEPAAA